MSEAADHGELIGRLDWKERAEAAESALAALVKLHATALERQAAEIAALRRQRAMLTESRRLAMRRAHARRAWHCTCGKTVHGNGGRAKHSLMHRERGDGHHFLTATEYERRRAATSPEAPAYSAKQRFTVDDFTAALLAGISAKGKTRIPIGKRQVEEAFRRIVSLLQESALNASQAGNRDLAFDILDVLEELRPDPNSGSLAGFWASLLRQQPGRASVPNPSYDYLELRIPPSQAEKHLDHIPSPWKPLVLQAVRLMMHELQ